METVIEAEYTVASLALANRDSRIPGWQQEIEGLLAWAKANEVTDKETAERASADLIAIRGLRKAIEVAHKEWKKPALEIGRVADNTFHLLADPLDEASKVYDGKLTAYRKAQEQQKREAETINEVVGTDVVEVVDPQKHVRSDFGSLTFVPDQPDTAKVKDAVDRLMLPILPEIEKLLPKIPGVYIKVAWDAKVIDRKLLPEEYRKVGTRVNGVRG
jgi:hypothetical protein